MLRRPLSSFVLPCGCLGGVYEHYNGLVVRLIDAPGATCTSASHRAGALVVDDEVVEDSAQTRGALGRWVTRGKRRSSLDDSQPDRRS